MGSVKTGARATLFVFLLLLIDCKSESSQASQRVELRKLDGELIELVPRAGLPPHCLVFSISQGGIVRELTKNAESRSIECPPGRAIGGHPFQIPLREGKARIYAVFSDQKLAADPIAEQIVEHGKKSDISALDLRAPGRLMTDMVEFVPEPPRASPRGDR